MICSAKRNHLTPQLFEKLLLQRVNNKGWPITYDQLACAKHQPFEYSVNQCVMKNVLSFRCLNPLYTCFITNRRLIAAAGWQHWIMFKFKETVKTNESSCYLSVQTVLFRTMSQIKCYIFCVKYNFPLLLSKA